MKNQFNQFQQNAYSDREFKEIERDLAPNIELPPGTQRQPVIEGLRADNVETYMSEGVFDKDIEYFRKYQNRKIGYKNLDRYVTLYPGLAALGGASSLGKTTFAVNLANEINQHRY